MASACFFARCASLPARLVAHPTPLAITSCSRLRRLGAEGARPVCAAGRMLGSVRYGTGAALGPKEAGAEVAAVPPSVPVRVAYELQLAGHRYLDVRTEGEFGGGHPAGAVNIPYMHSTGSGNSINQTHFTPVKLPLVSCDHRKKYMGPMLARSVIVNHLVQRKKCCIFGPEWFQNMNIRTNLTN
uniref:Rhodanese domain-containing protein n=1 Tax=Aegilops tauschii subsp. strangulata TaxID=200361 RepID=A0A453TAP2_AEGTS